MEWGPRAEEPAGGLPTGEESWPLQRSGLKEVCEGGAAGSLWRGSAAGT